jgi:hypothetical protein
MNKRAPTGPARSNNYSISDKTTIDKDESYEWEKTIQNIPVKHYNYMSSEGQQVLQSTDCDKKPSSIPVVFLGPPHPTVKKGTPTITVPYSYFLEENLA